MNDPRLADSEPYEDNRPHSEGRSTATPPSYGTAPAFVPSPLLFRTGGRGCGGWRSGTVRCSRCTVR